MTRERVKTSPEQTRRRYGVTTILGLALVMGCSGGGGSASEPMAMPVSALVPVATLAVTSDRYSGAIDYGAGHGIATGAASNETTTVQWGTQQ